MSIEKTREMGNAQSRAEDPALKKPQLLAAVGNLQITGSIGIREAVKSKVFSIISEVAFGSASKRTLELGQKNAEQIKDFLDSNLKGLCTTGEISRRPNGLFALEVQKPFSAGNTIPVPVEKQVQPVIQSSFAGWSKFAKNLTPEMKKMGLEILNSVSESFGSNSPLYSSFSYLMSNLGVKYKWGASGPNAFDCSGLVGPYIFRALSKGDPEVARQLLDKYEAGEFPRITSQAVYSSRAVVYAPIDFTQRPDKGQNPGASLNLGDVIVRRAKGHLAVVVDIDNMKNTITLAHAASDKGKVTLEELSAEQFAKRYTDKAHSSSETARVAVLPVENFHSFAEFALAKVHQETQYAALSKKERQA